MAESDIQSSILNYLKYLGAWTVKTVTTNKGGTPDILACLPVKKEDLLILTADMEDHDDIGIFVAIEVKDTGKKAVPLQAAQLRRIIKAGGIAFETDSLDEVKKNFKLHFE